MISFGVGDSFNYAHSTYCPKDGIIDTYATLLEAQRACLSDSQCDIVFDYECDGDKFNTCKGPVKSSTKGSCTWLKTGT